MTTASCSDYSLLTPPPTDCHRVRTGPISALLYDEYDAAATPLHHRGPYNLTAWQQSSSSYQFSRASVVDRSQSMYNATPQSHHLGSSSTSTPAAAVDQGHYAASQRCDPSGYRVAAAAAADSPYSYATPIGAGPGSRCVSGLQPDALSPAYSPYGGGAGRCLQAGPVSSSSMRGCCVSGYCSPAGPCRCTGGGGDRLYEHSAAHGDPVTVNGTGHIAGEHVSCRLQHHHQQQHPLQSTGTYKWMTIKRSMPKTTPSGRCTSEIRKQF